MTTIFLEIFNISVMASWLTLAIVILRLIFKKAPKNFRMILWALVGIRLLCPFSLESTYSLTPSSETIPSSILTSETPQINTGIELIDNSVNPVISEKLAPTVGANINPMQEILNVCAIIWIIGIIGMVVYVGMSYVRIRKQVQEAIPLGENPRENIFLCDNVVSPFLLGIIHPRVYLPSDMKEENKEYVIAHEKAHMSRGDHWWKPLGFALLTIYWFHPMMWLAYILFCKDIEFACDEKVLLDMGTYVKKSYSDALIDCSASKHKVNACPLAFGETSIKERIQSVLNYKKPAFWVEIGVVLICIVVAVCFLTNPGGKDYKIINVSAGSDNEDVSYRYVDGYWDSKASYIEVEWTNHSDRDILYGEEFSLYKDGKPIPMKEDYGFLSIGYILEPGSTTTLKHSFIVYDYNFSESGTYRIEQDFQFDGNNYFKDPHYTVYVEFEVRKK